MFLHLAADVLGQLVNRVGDLGRCLTRAPGHALWMEGRLGHPAVGQRGGALFVDRHVEGGQLGDLPADPAESLQDMLPKLVIDLDVATTNLDPHPASFELGSSRSYAPTP